MKVFFDDIAVLDQEYQEVLIDNNNFKSVNYKSLNKQDLNIQGIMYNGIYVLEPLNYYKITLKDVESFKEFIPLGRLLEAGLILSEVDKTTMSVFVYNCTHNHVYIKSDIAIGEIK